MNKVNIFIKCAFLFIAVSSLTGCIKEKTNTAEEKPTALAIIYGKHSNSKLINIDTKQFNDIYSDFGNVTLIINDGEPELEIQDNKIVGYYDGEYIKESKENAQYKEIWQRDYIDNQTTSLIEGLESAVAVEPEADTLKSLQKGLDAINKMESSMGSDIKKEMVIYDTGLSTKGEFNFLNEECLNLLSNKKKIWEDEESKEKLNEIIDRLDEKMEIPDLSGITVTWYGLGEVGGEQEELNELNKKNLQYIWGEILKRSNAVSSNKTGADSNYGIFIDVFTNGIVENAPLVTKIIFWNGSEPVKLTEEQLGFLPNSTEYRDDKIARKIISPVANNILNYPNLNILLVGTTADPNRNGGDIPLSNDRAEKVKQTLCELGVPENRIKTIGVGAKSSRYKDEWSTGVFDEEIAKENRSVIILSIESKEAGEILSTDWD
ncbi:MAG: OmpA family protein [Firmicutes bacterium]|nr:OmpA family protein [Bacillota bacterium]